MAKLLVVDHDTNTARDLVTYLTNLGHEADSVETAKRAFERAVAGVDLLLVSGQLADLSGTELCRAVRSDARIHALPVIMLGSSNNEIDRVVSFEVGADDFVSKPYSLRELELRVRAVLRRRPRTKRGTPTKLGTIELHIAAHRVTVQGREVMLSALEFKLLVALYEQRGRVQSRQSLIDTVWRATKGVSTRTVDACVKRLRQKLGPAGQHVQTVRGVGYRFTEEL